jgi:hypothetical protein
MRCPSSSIQWFTGTVMGRAMRFISRATSKVKHSTPGSFLGSAQFSIDSPKDACGAAGAAGVSGCFSARKYMLMVNRSGRSLGALKERIMDSMPFDCPLISPLAMDVE